MYLSLVSSYVKLSNVCECIPTDNICISPGNITYIYLKETSHKSQYKFQQDNFKFYVSRTYSLCEQILKLL